MRKLLGVIIAVLVVVAIAGYLLTRQQTEEETKAVSGYSVKDTEIEAVEEAVSMIKADIPEPDYVILFSTVEDKVLGRKGYNPETVLKEVNRLLPNTKVYGGTSQQGILTKDGYYQGDNAALAMLAVSSPRITFGVAGANVNDYASAKEAGKAAIQNAIKDAGKEGEYPQLILMTGSIGNEEEMLAGIEDIIGWGIPVIGGSAGDNSIFSGIYREFANDKTYFNGVSLTAIFTDLKIGYAYEAGFDLKKEKGTITKAKGRVIYEINNRPAGEVLNEWCSGCLSEKIKTGGSTMPETLFSSLAKVIKTESGTYYLSVAVLGVNAEDKSLNTFANVMTGDEILLMEGDWRIYVEKAKMVSKKAMSSKGISKGESLFGIYTSCAGIRTGTPEQERPKIVSAVSEEIGKEVPFIGPFTFGEEGPLGLVNHHGNFINSLILFSEKK